MLVTVLTASMILGLLTIVVLIVIRVPNVISTSVDPVPLPASITLPDGSEADSFTQGSDWYAVVTKEGVILIFNRDDGSLRQSIKIKSR
ncbi:MAG: hypothetical protein GXP05_05800 [Alphaproteobacteria bacterium]|nr:hypothetical protein [Alphaproteobacteria bacterium]